MSVRKALLAAAVVLGAAGGALVHSLGSTAAPSLALPELHGQMSWAAGIRPAPVRSLHGRTAVLALLRPGCPGCVELRAELASVIRRLPPSDRPVLVVARGTETPVVYLIDRHGDERTGYLFPFAPAFVEGDLRALATERLP